MPGSISMSRGRGKRIGILLSNIRIVKMLTALQVKNKGQGIGEI